ncbi:hypothetical protein [Bradyrhizobium sp. JYMT SZCCT0428]|uniref:hypothetical protein n=1 Tax=Bradyrhizobium sp. JYMT SZCCT0428 TaxID=2807673 RepID=UPI001BA5DED1|nr:hypothetical protein [Bradyrhizobium sp. JYMT SZCCT0428]MBR1156279.1 hypothetical protein [Bradyrhizobium sp. JYMT SZCCT0428]
MPTRAERLADHFIRCAGIAAVHVDAAGAIGAVDTATMFDPGGRVVLCCARGNHIKVATLAAARAALGSGHAAARAAVHAAAAEMGVGLTPLSTVIQRAFAAVQMVDDQIVDLQQSGGIKELNKDFKAARTAGTAVRYVDFLFEKKMSLLEAIARAGHGG